MLLELHMSTCVAAVAMVDGHVLVHLLAMHMSLEALVLVGCVVDSTLVAIGIDQLIVSSHLVALPCLALFLDITCLGILDSILEVVLGMGVMVIAMVVVMLMVASVMVIVVGDQMHRCVTGGSTMKRSCPNDHKGQQGKGESNGYLQRRGSCSQRLSEPCRSYLRGHGAAADLSADLA